MGYVSDNSWDSYSTKIVALFLPIVLVLGGLTGCDLIGGSPDSKVKTYILHGKTFSDKPVSMDISLTNGSHKWSAEGKDFLDEKTLLKPLT